MRQRITFAVLLTIGLLAGTLPFAYAQGPQPPGGQGLAALVGWVRDGGVVRLFQSADTVGIGTTTPAEKLHVVGNVRIDGDLSCPGCVHTADLANGAVTTTKIADGAVTTAKLAANAVDTAKIADGSVGAADVNPAEVQVRVSGSCALGSSIRAIDSTGDVTCEADDDTSYTVGPGLALSSNQFSVQFGGSGSATTVARSDHTHELADGSVTPAKLGADVNALLNDLSDQNRALQARVSALETLLFTPWRPQTSGTGNLLISVWAVDANTAWAVGSSGTIIKTTNGGATWVTQASGTTAELYGVVAADATTAWTVGELTGASGSDYVVLKTTDGGATWSLRIIDRSLASGGTRALRAVAAADRNTLWAVGDCGTIFKTTDGGATWVPRHQTCGDGFSSIATVDTNTVWAAGTGRILKTTNGGAT